MCVCFWAYLTAVSDTPYLQAESVSFKSKIYMFLKANLHEPLSKGLFVVAQVGLKLCCCPLPRGTCQNVCIIPFEHGDNKGVGVYFLRDLYSWQLFWGRKEKKSVQASEITFPLFFPNTSQRWCAGLAVSLCKCSIWASLKCGLRPPD